MLRSDIPELKQLVAETVASTVHALEELAQKQDVAKAIKSERVQRAISYLRVAKQARETAEQERKLTSLAGKVDAISTWVEGEKADARKPGRSTKLSRMLNTCCLMNPSASEREADKRAFWAAKSDDAGSFDAIMNDMFKRPAR